MKINSFIQNIATGLKTNSSTQTKEKSVSETLIQDYKQGLPGPVKSIYDKYKITPTNDDVKEINQFLKNASGSNDEKLMSIDIALYKGISPSEDNLTTIQQSLSHDTDVVASLAEIPSTEDAEPLTKEQSLTLIEHLKLPESIKAALKELVKNEMPLDKAVLKVAQLLKLDQGKTSISISELKDLIDSNPNLKALGGKLEQIMQTIQSLKQPTITNAIAETVEKQANGASNNTLTIKSVEVAYNESGVIDDVVGSKTENHKENTNSIADEGASLSGQMREGVSNADISATQSDKSTSAITSTSTNTSTAAEVSVDEESAMGEEETIGEEDARLKMINEAIDTLMTQMSDVFSSLENDLSLKTYLVESTTEATIKAKATFENFKAEVTQLLTPNPEMPKTTPAELSSQIATSIEKLNNLILKSEVTLYTDMFTEKKLLLMSSELDKASQMLKQGELAKAQSTVNEAVKLLKQIDFTPSIRKLQVFANQRLEQLGNVLKLDQKFEQKTDQKLKTLIKTQIQTLGDQQGNKLSRDVLETLRFLGLNHEMEVAENLEKGDFEALKERSSGNVKEILLKMMKEDSQERGVEATEQNLMNLSGQQMMNDQSSQDQPFYFFNFPVMDGEDLGNMKVFMKGASKNSQMDWQNSELYFGMSLKEVGQVGIRVKIQQAKVDIQVSSERAGKLEAPLKVALQTLSEIGFTAGEITYKTGSDESPVKLKPSFEKGVTNLSDGKGFDFKV